MSDLPANGAIPLLATQAAAKIAFEALRDVMAELPGGDAGSALTIAAGVVTATRARHSIDTQGAAPTDDLDRIAQDNHPQDRLLVIHAESAARVVTVKHNAGGLGTIMLDDGVDFVLNSTKKKLLLRREGTTWVEVLRVYGDKIEEMRAWLQLEPDTASTAADRNITAADRGKVITLTGGTDRTFTFTASPAALGDGWECVFKNASTAFLTIVPNAGTIDGKATLVLKPGELVRGRSDATNMDITAARLLWRERLSANRTYYVRPDGNDANTGLADTAGGAFLTPQKAADVIHGQLDLAGFTVTVQLADSTAYTSGVLMRGFCVGQKDENSIVFQGNNATPANVRINVTAGTCFKAEAGAQFTVKDMELRTTTSGDCLGSEDRGSIIRSNKVFYGACAGIHMNAVLGGFITVSNVAYTISGGAQIHILASLQGFIRHQVSATVTLTGTPAFTNCFARAEMTSTILGNGTVFSGAATGVRYEVATGSIIFTNGGGANYYPGNSAGSVDALSGHYV